MERETESALVTSATLFVFLMVVVYGFVLSIRTHSQELEDQRKYATGWEDLEFTAPHFSSEHKIVFDNGFVYREAQGNKYRGWTITEYRRTAEERKWRKLETRN